VVILDPVNKTAAVIHVELCFCWLTMPSDTQAYRSSGLSGLPGGVPWPDSASCTALDQNRPALAAAPYSPPSLRADTLNAIIHSLAGDLCRFHLSDVARFWIWYLARYHIWFGTYMVPALP